MILSPEHAFAVLVGRPEPERTLTPLAAATGLHIGHRLSQCGKQWLLVCNVESGDVVYLRVGILRTRFLPPVR
jgi:hypothetical protein